MPGNYARYNVEAEGNIIFAANYNAEHDNHITNATPSGLDDYSANAAQSQAQTSPGSFASPSLATSTAGELERLRYQIAQIIGGPNASWQDAPNTSLGSLSLQNETLGIGLEFEGHLGGASSTTNVLAKLINQGAIINAASLSTADVAIADLDSTNKKFGAYSYILGSGNILAFPGWYNNPVTGTISAWVRGLASGDYIACNPLLGLEFFINGSSKLVARATERTAATESTKTQHTVTGDDQSNYVTEMASTWRNAILQWRFNDEGGGSTDVLNIAWDGTLDTSVNESSQDIDINPGNGGIWFPGAKLNNPTWDHYLANSGLPTAHSDAWTSNGTPNGSVSAGSLTIATSAAAGFYSKTGATLTGVDLANETIEVKMKLVSTSTLRSQLGSSLCELYMRDDSMNRSVYLEFYKTSVALFYGTNGGTDLCVFEMQLDTSKEHVYRITTNGGTNPVVNLYVDGLLVFSGTNSTADTSANDLIRFGSIASCTATHVWEWVAYANEVAAPIVASSQGNIDSFGIANSVASASVISRLQTAKVSDVYGRLPSYGPTLPYLSVFDRNGALSTSSTTFEAVGSYAYYIPGDGVTEYGFDFGAAVTNGTAANAVAFAIDVNTDQIGVGIGSGGLAYPASYSQQSINAQLEAKTLSRKLVLPVGLNTVKPVFGTDSGSNALQEQSVWWERAITKEGRLA